MNPHCCSPTAFFQRLKYEIFYNFFNSTSDKHSSFDIIVLYEVFSSYLYEVPYYTGAQYKHELTISHQLWKGFGH